MIHYYGNERMERKSMMRTKQKAFTLAETLITLAIIGVIAAMTIPTLMTKVNDYIYKTALKKAYSQLTNAVKMIPISQGCSDGDYYCGSISLANIANNMKTLENGTGQGYQVGNSTYAGYFKTTDGMLFYGALRSTKSCYKMLNGQERCMDMMITSGMYLPLEVNIDVNGDKGPNKKDIDRFTFKITPDYGQFTRGIPGTITPTGKAAEILLKK